MSALSALYFLLVAFSLLLQCFGTVTEELREIKLQLSSLDARLVQQRMSRRQEHDAIDGKLDKILDRLADIQKKNVDEKATGVSRELKNRQQPFHNESQISTVENNNECRRRTTTSRHLYNRIMLSGNVQALCDTDTDCGGWIVIQRREKGDVNFYRNWQEYKNGFGTTDTDYWLGLKTIHELVAGGYSELLIDMRLKDTTYFAHYFQLRVGTELSGYQMTVGQYYGTAGDSLKFHNGSRFSTFDVDNDSHATNCAEQFHGAWWCANCYHSNLNGLWGSNTHSGVVWRDIVSEKSLSFTEIKIRRPGR